jgi:hypothetical protein
VHLLVKPSAAAIVDFSIKTPLGFDPSTGDLASALLQLQVDLEVAAGQQQQQQQVAVTVDLCLSDGTVLLADLPTKLEQVGGGSSDCMVQRLTLL